MLFISENLLAQHYNFKQVSIREGLPQSQAFDIEFDQNDFAWIATQGGGLCKYDGFSFEYFTKQDSLLSNRIYCISRWKDELWIGQKGGVSVFNEEGEFLRNFRLWNSEIVVQDILIDSISVFLATNSGVLELKSTRFEMSPNPNLQGINGFEFFVDEKNEYWVCSEVGMLHLYDPLKKLNKNRGLSSSYVNSAIVYKNYWLIGTYGGGLNIYNRSTNKCEVPALFRDKIVRCIMEKGEEEIWVGTMNSGLYAYNIVTGDYKNYKSTNGLSSNNIKVLRKDAWGDVWIGTSGGGVAIYKNSPFIAYSSLSGLNSDYVFSVCFDKRNNLWVGTDANGVLRMNDTSLVSFDDEIGFYNEKVKAIFEDSKGFVWIGTEGKGLAIYSPYDGKDTLYLYEQKSGLRGNWVKSFAEDNQGNIFIGTSDNGIFWINKGPDFPKLANFKKVTGSSKLPKRTTGLFSDNQRMWFSSSEGSFGYFKKNTVKVFEVDGVDFRNIVVSKNKIWLGTVDRGVYSAVIIGDSLAEPHYLNTDNYLPSNNVYQLISSDNYLWVGTEKGLQRLTLDEKGNVLKSDFFGSNEGFEGLETNMNACYKDYRNNLWFGTVDGLFQYVGGERDTLQDEPPKLRITDVQIFYNSIDSTQYADYFENGSFTKYLTLPYESNHVGFSFEAIHYAAPEKIRFSWFLEGADKGWTPPTTNKSATYSNLNPGNYTFHLKSSIDDNWALPEQMLSFTIDKPFWDKTWFKLGYYLIGVLILFSIFLSVYFRTKRKNKRLREKIELEKNLLELEQKALRLQMNPHFIFNVLNSIHNQIILNDSDKARYALSKFSKLMRRILENSREKFISIDDEIETIENYVQLEKLTNDMAFEFNVKIDDEVDTSEEILPPLLIQPFIENAIIHGIKEKGDQGKIEVGFKLLNEHLLECWVADNGVGREAAAKHIQQKESYHKSTALSVTQERLNNLNEERDFKSFEIIDLKENNLPAGTKVVLRIRI